MADQSNGVAVDASADKQPTPVPSGEIGVAPQNTADSTTDNGQSRRPRDARVVHLILASMGVHAYHERVPLQIMDFAYRTLQPSRRYELKSYILTFRDRIHLRRSARRTDLR